MGHPVRDVPRPISATIAASSVHGRTGSEWYHSWYSLAGKAYEVYHPYKEGMAKTRFVQFLVNANQYERIKLNAQARGYASMAAYLRDLALTKDVIFERKLNEMYDMIVKGNKTGE